MIQYNNIANVYYSQGECEKVSRPLVADSYNNIGGVYLQKGDLENALLQYQRALEIRTRVFGS